MISLQHRILFAFSLVLLSIPAGAANAQNPFANITTPIGPPKVPNPPYIASGSIVNVTGTLGMPPGTITGINYHLQDNDPPYTQRYSNTVDGDYQIQMFNHTFNAPTVAAGSQHICILTVSVLGEDRTPLAGGVSSVTIVIIGPPG